MNNSCSTCAKGEQATEEELLARLDEVIAEYRHTRTGLERAGITQETGLKSIAA